LIECEADDEGSLDGEPLGLLTSLHSQTMDRTQEKRHTGKLPKSPSISLCDPVCIEMTDEQRRRAIEALTNLLATSLFRRVPGGSPITFPSEVMEM
jgi:hypothetical protein